MGSILFIKIDFKKENAKENFFLAFQPAELLNNNELDRIKPGTVSLFPVLSTDFTYVFLSE
jgi:hypothetical protein